MPQELPKQPKEWVNMTPQERISLMGSMPSQLGDTFRDVVLANKFLRGKIALYCFITGWLLFVTFYTIPALYPLVQP